MDLFLKISKTILDTNYKTTDNLAKFLQSQFAIMRVMQSDDDKKKVLSEMDDLNIEIRKVKSEIQKMIFDKKRGRVIDTSILNKKHNTLKDLGARFEMLKRHLSAIKQEAISASNILHEKKNDLFIRNVKKTLVREFGLEKQQSIFRECYVEMQELSESITIN